MRKKSAKIAKAFVTRVPLELGKPTKSLFQARIDVDLLTAVRASAAARDWNIARVVEWGMREFLAHVDPKKAKDLNIEMNG